jgi:hypothetical protein
MIYYLRKNDFKNYVVFTLIATLISVYSVYVVTTKFGKVAFSNFAFYSILTSIFFTVSDLGFKISYFKIGKLNKKSDYKYLLLSKLIVVLFLFILFGFFYNDMIYLSLIFILVGTSIFPSYFLQEYRLYTIIGFNNLIFRLLPILILFKLNSIVEFAIISGIVIIIFSSYLLIKLRIITFNNFIWRDFINYFKEVVITNRYLSAINIVSIIEINIHTFLAKSLFSFNDFADYIYLERYISYLKQGVIYFYDYLFPKVNLSNFNHYLKFTRLTYISYFVFLILAQYLFNLYQIKNIYGIKLSIFFYVYCLYPFSSIVFNFLINILFFKYCSDKYSFNIIFASIFVKFILIIYLSPFLGIATIPSVLILLEIVTGITRYYLMPLEIRKTLKF